MGRKTPCVTLFRCDHLRPVVCLEDGWHHIMEDTGRPASRCIAGVYREPATLPDNWGSLLDYRVLEEANH
jgi:hypothetical protein